MALKRILLMFLIFLSVKCFPQGCQIEVNTSLLSPNNIEKYVTFTVKDYLNNLISCMPFPMRIESYGPTISCRNQITLMLNNGFSISRSIESNIGSPRLFTFFFSDQERTSIEQFGISYIRISDSVSKEIYWKFLTELESKNLFSSKDQINSGNSVGLDEDSPGDVIPEVESGDK